MRRGLLVVGAQGGGSGPLTVGMDPVQASTTGLSDGTLYVETSHPASATGTIATVHANLGSAGSFTVCVGTVSGTSFTIKQSVDLTATGSGVQTFATSIPVDVGDCIGYWAPFGSSGRCRQGTGGSRLQINTGGAKPTSGTLTGGTSVATVSACIGGTNP